MKRESVESSNLASVGYDAAKQILEIEFNHGGIYQYSDVPQEVYNELMRADSLGRYFANKIKNNYEFERMN